MKRALVFLILAAATATSAAAQDDRAKTAYDHSPCSMCHGDAGGGDVGPALVPMTYELTEFTGIVRGGIGHMPPVGRDEISDADLQLVFAFLKARSAGEPVRVTDPNAGPSLVDIHARVDRARRASDVDALGTAAGDARKLAADADLAATVATLESIVQKTDYEQHAAEALPLIQKIRGALDARDPRAGFLEGLSSALAAGSLDRAERAFQEATKSLPAGAADNWPGWTQADAWAWLGRVLVKKGDVPSARRAYQRALELEPNYLWVTKVLLPGLR